jgi:DNA-binding LytR/AlgR family response regulator
VFNNHQSNISIEPQATYTNVKDFIFIKENHRFVKLQFNEIIYIESCENYVVVHTKDKKSNIVRSTFTDFLEQLPAHKFIRTHRGYAVQLSFVDNIEPTELQAHGFKVPVSASYKAILFEKLGIN